MRDAQVYAETLWRLCTLARLPFDYAATADELAQTLDRYHDAANGRLDLATEPATSRSSLGRELRDGALIISIPSRQTHADRARSSARSHQLHAIGTIRARSRPRYAAAAGSR